MKTKEELIGLIPAAGKGTRLNLPYPKELYPIIENNRYKPLAQYVVENLIASGVRNIIFVINETKHQLIGYFGSGSRFGCQFSYVVQENNDSLNTSTSPGLASALDSAYHLTRGKTVLFGMADTIIQPTDIFHQMISCVNRYDQVILGLFAVTRPEKFGMVEMNGDGQVCQIVDKPKQTQLTNAWGCIAWRPDFTEHLHACVTEKKIGDFALIMNQAIQSNMLFRGVHLPDSRFADLGTYEEILELENKYRG